MILLDSPHLLRGPMWWAIVNNQDKRILITYSMRTIDGVLERLRKIAVRNHHQPKQLILDYFAGLTQVIQLEDMGTFDKYKAEVGKARWMDAYKALGWTLYNARDIRRLYAVVVPDEASQRVYVVAKPRLGEVDLNKHLVLGTFSSVRKARIWRDITYPSVSHFVDRIVMYERK